METNDSLLPTDICSGTEGFATYNANGTRPFTVESRQADAKTVVVVNATWWDEPKHNLNRIQLTPVTSAATRVASLWTGVINIINDAPVQDLPRLAATPDVEVLDGVDLRTLMIGFPFSDTLVSDECNPSKDEIVREALYKAIDLDLILQKVMRGKSCIGGAPVVPPIRGHAQKLDTRRGYDPDAEKALVKEAGGPEGMVFE